MATTDSSSKPDTDAKEPQEPKDSVSEETTKNETPSIEDAPEGSQPTETKDPVKEEDAVKAETPAETGKPAETEVTKAEETPAEEAKVEEVKVEEVKAVDAETPEKKAEETAVSETVSETEVPDAEKPAQTSSSTPSFGTPAEKTESKTEAPGGDKPAPAAVATKVAAPRKRPTFKMGNLRENGIYIAFAAIVLLFAVLTDFRLLQPQNLSNVIIQNSYILILAIGMILIIIAGHIDLSVGSVLAATGAFSAVLMVNHDVHWAIAIPLTLLLGALIGAWQGYWVAYFGIPAFIVTLAGMLIFRAVTMMILGNQGIGPFPDTVRSMANGFTPGWLGNVALGPLGGADLVTLILGLALVVAIVWTQWRARAARKGYGQDVEPMALFVAKVLAPSIVLMFVIVQLARFKNLPWVLLLLGVLVVVYTLVTGRAVFGRHIYAIGGNLNAAMLSGVKVKQVTFWLFVNMGVLSAIAGIIFAGRLNLAGPTAGNSFELDAIAAAFIGGAAVQGGVGKVVGAITGGLIMAVINNGMSLLGAPSEQVSLVKGLVLLLAVAFDVWAKRRAGASAR